MAHRDFRPEDILLILGAPRSGTTWLAAIFDSHQDILYRHEPDTVLRRNTIPGPCPRAVIPLFRAEARNYLLELATLSLPKTVGRPLLFRKSYRSPVASLARLGQFGLLRAVGRGWPGADTIPIADWLRRGSQPRILIKSISGCGRAGLYADALPEARVIFILRSPYGQVASMLRGTRLGRLDGMAATNGLWKWPEAVRCGLSRDDFDAMPLIERLAWHWALHSEKALDDLDGRANVRIVCYETLCAQPRRTADALFAFAGLTMGKQTRRFVARSSHGHRDAAYFAVHKNAAATASAWQAELTEAAQATITTIVAKTRAYGLYCALAGNFAASASRAPEFRGLAVM